MFDAVVAEVKDRAPPLGVADKGVGAMASEYRWHTRDGARRQAGAATVADDDVQFRVTVLVQKRDAGSAVIAEPQILSTFGGNPGGRELTRKDGDWPEWADSKTDAIVHAVYDRLKACASS